MQDVQDRRRRNPRPSDEYAQEAARLRHQVDRAQLEFRNLLAEGLVGCDEATRMVDSIIAMRHELWGNMELYFGALRQELAAMIDSSDIEVRPGESVAVATPLSEANGRFASNN